MRFYVYAPTYDDVILYVGKGTGRRLQNQRRMFGLQGHELARFRKERDAYKFEREAIAEHQPWLNRHPGGNGSFATPIRKPRRQAWEIEMDRIGTRLYAINLLKRFGKSLDLNWPALLEAEALLTSQKQST